MRQKPFEVYLFFGNYENILCRAFKSLANALAALNTGTKERKSDMSSTATVNCPRAAEAKLCLSQKPQTRPRGQIRCCSSRQAPTARKRKGKASSMRTL